MRELTEEQIERNKNTFIQLVESIKIEGMLKKELIDYLEKSDFFTAPASTTFHMSCPGGLCQHSLNVYYNLLTLVDDFASHTEFRDPDESSVEEVRVRHFSEDTLKIVALFHDISKANFYEKYMRNVNTGEKDQKGKDIWIQVPSYKVKDGSDRFVGVNHEVNSYIIISRYIPLSEEELIAICNHHCCTGDGNTNKDLTYIMDKYPLASLLHMADFVSCYVTESLMHE